MAKEIQVTFDCADPGALAEFWAEALGYEVQGHRRASTPGRMR